MDATTIGNFNPLAAAVFPPRAVAYCPCGTRLSRYRPPMTNLCWPCEARHLAAASVVELHPPIEDKHERWRRQHRDRRTRACPTCGGPMHYQAKTCRACRYAA